MSGERRRSLATASEGNTDFAFVGIFRDIHAKEEREKLYKAQELVSNNNWDEAKALLKEALTDNIDDHDVRNLTLILEEVERYQERIIPDDTTPADELNWDEVSRRPVSKYVEKFNEIPQGIFLLRSNENDRVIVGRRILSHQFVKNKIRELHCSHVTASMLLGKLVDQRIREDGIVLFYNELTAGERIYLMNDILDNGMTEFEITYPFPALVHLNKEEIQSPEEGWEIDEKLALSLGEGEVYLRQFSIKFLKSLGVDDLHLFDCACSTGQFLHTMKNAIPNCYTIGSDLSQHMAEFAAKRVDEIHCANALKPPIKPQSVDIVFIRFINSEVIKTEIAHIFLKPLVECLKVGGHLIILGHTPILTSRAEIKMVVPNLEIVQCIGGSREWNGIFQFYIAKRTE